MRTDRRTEGRADTTKLIVAFRNFVNGPKKLITEGLLDVAKNFVLEVKRPQN
jgi:hypothetical protein